MNLFFFWSQGKAKLPAWANKNLKHWQKLNPNHKVTLLDSLALIKLKKEINFINDLPIQCQADILRIFLLTKQPGAWCDISLIPSVPLDDFIKKLDYSEIFLFSKPTNDRLLSNWFIYSQNMEIMSGVYRYVANYHSVKRSSIDGSRELLFRDIYESSDFLIQQKDKMPYFWFQYLLNYIFINDRGLSKALKKIDYISAISPHYLQHYLKSHKLANLDNSIILKNYKENALNKLDWRIEKDKLNLLFDVILDD